MGSGTSLYVLPNIRFRVDHAHVGLISTPVNQNTVVHLQKSVLCIVLKTLLRYYRTTHGEARKLAGICCPVVALFAKGIV